MIDSNEASKVDQDFPGLPPIEHLVTDSRRINFPKTSVFFALPGVRRDGHDFIQECFNKGVRHFVINRRVEETLYPGARFLLVRDVQRAMQTLVSAHRAKFDIPVIGITGSNGKTTVKEWLYQLLSPDFNIVRSPRSYNSQIGVPLSVWLMNERHTLGIFEAGISSIREMPNLAGVIQPNIGVLTNIGEAHKEGFIDNKQKLLEKLQLFPICKKLVYCKDAIAEYLDLETSGHTMFQQNLILFSWSRNTFATVRVLHEDIGHEDTVVTFEYRQEVHAVTVPFTDVASLNNAITCICVMLLLEVPIEDVQERVPLLMPLEMRLQLKKGANNCYVLNDSYSMDLSSLGIALDYLQQQSGNGPTTVILSDIPESGFEEKEELYQTVAYELETRNIQKLIGIGEEISHHRHLFYGFVPHSAFFLSTDDFLDHYLGPQATPKPFNNEYILLKGARIFAFERIAHWLEKTTHETVMEIDLTAVQHNLNQFKQSLKPKTKIMAMVKAFSYGSGSIEVARLLQYHKVDYLAVAYIDEGIELRAAGISLPILVMNIDHTGYPSLLEYNLEPEIYSANLYHDLHEYLLGQGIVKFPVHIKVNTGMNRLGFEPEEIPLLGELLVKYNTMTVQSLFSHLVGSDDPTLDNFTIKQAQLFSETSIKLWEKLKYPFIRHLANTTAINRHPSLHFDMVRVGIGLYGIGGRSINGEKKLRPAASLKTTISQIRNVPQDSTVGYGRKGKLERDSWIATIRIGYADGFGRVFSNGKGKVLIHGRLAPVVGNVCMDMTMVDITDIDDVMEGDQVEIFGKELAIEEVAKWAGTIPYEILTGIGHRVNRVYVEE